MFRRKSDPSPSIVQLGKKLVSDALRLARVEADLVKARFSAMLRRAGLGAGLVAGGAVMAFLGIVGVLVAVGLALGIVLPAWVAALVVAGTLIGAGAATAVLGRNELRAATKARSSGPVEIETELQETRYRLEAELEALTAKVDPRHLAGNNGSARTRHTTP
jgi:putative superfamily III holin-X/uncharacterized protein DUF3618